jgi:ATP-dependent protease Clp ATPase subunit
MSQSKPGCSFCHKGNGECAMVVASDDVAICNICIERARDIVGAFRLLPEALRAAYGNQSTDPAKEPK